MLTTKSGVECLTIRVVRRQRMANVAAFHLLTKELNTIPVRQLIIINCGVQWILRTKETGEIAVSTTAIGLGLTVDFFFALDLVQSR